MHIGERIRKLRRERDLTQDYMAEKMGVSVAYISKIETGRSDPDTELLRRFATALNVSVRDFFEDELKSSGVQETQEASDAYRTIALGSIPFLGRIAADASGKDSFDDDVSPMATIPYFKTRNQRDLFAIELATQSMLFGDTPILPGDICVFDKSKTPQVGDVVAVEMKTKERLVKIFFHDDGDTIEFRSSNKYVAQQHVTLRKDRIASIAVLVAKFLIGDEQKREYGLTK